MPAAIPVAVAVMAASTVYQAVDANQQRQHAKGAMEANKTALDASVRQEKNTEDLNQKKKQYLAAGTQAAAIRAIQGSMGVGSGFGGTLLTGPTGTGGAAPTQAKTLLGA